MERFGEKPERRKAGPALQEKLEQSPSLLDDAQAEARTGLAERFAQTKGRIAAALLSIGISIPEVPPAHAVEPVPNEQSEQIVNETLTPSVVEKIREAGFDVRTTLSRPENSAHPSYYMVHMGQIHEATFAGLDRAMAQKTVDAYQRRMYSIYPFLVAACNSPIFREGRIDDELVDKSHIEQHDAQVSDMVSTLLDSQLNSVEDALTLVTKMMETKVTPENFRTHPRAQELADAFTVATQNLNHFKQSVSGEDKNSGQYKKFDFLLRTLEVKSVSNILGGTGAYFKASSRLFYENQVDLFGAEDLEANQKAVALFRESKTAEGRLKELEEEARIRFQDTSDGEERVKLRKEIVESENLTEEEKASFARRFSTLLEAEKQYIHDSIENNPEYQALLATIAEAEHAVEDVREAAAYEKVNTFLKKYPDYGGSGLKCAVVEYGHNHTFAESAEIWNTQPDVHVPFGVIEIYDPTIPKDKE